MLVKTVCYNLDQRLAYPQYAEAIARVLEHFQADVIFLQEVMIWKEVEWLATRLKMHCDRRAWTRGGYTVLSRQAPEEFFRCVVPSSDWGAGAAGARIGRVWYISQHLDDVAYKRDETQRLREQIYILGKLPKGAAVLAGDFNSPSHLDGHAKILPSTLMEQADWCDVQAHRKWTRGTWMKSRSQLPDRIDRIYTKYVQCKAGGIVDHHDMGLARWPTGVDHRLLWQQFKV
jgi:endonuclease/exonuclease/phosphatase family metal-dependent hydrolase